MNAHTTYPPYLSLLENIRNFLFLLGVKMYCQPLQSPVIIYIVFGIVFFQKRVDMAVVKGRGNLIIRRYGYMRLDIAVIEIVSLKEYVKEILDR